MKPEILIHEIIPPSLKHLSVKETNKKHWWTKARKSASEKSDDCCHACGIHKGKQRFRKTLSGHELYDINYKDKTVTLKEVVVLCNLCHAFLHIGDVIRKYKEGIVSAGYVAVTLNHGVNLLSRNNLKPTAKQAIHWLIYIKDYSTEQAIEYVVKNGLVETRKEIGFEDIWRYKDG